MITRNRFAAIMAIALPIMGGMVSQNILNIVDTAMVGALGKVSLAAVGLASMANFMCIAFITGISSGVQAIAARRKGEERDAEMAVPLNGGLLMALLLGVPLTVILMFSSTGIMGLLSDDIRVVEEGGEYLAIRLAGMVAIGMNFAFRGYWNAINLSMLYMRTLIVMHIANVILNYLLIFGHFGFPAMGSAGAGLATTLSVFLGTAIYFYLGWKHARANGFLQGIPPRHDLLVMMKQALPSSIQQFFFAAGLTAQMWIVGMVSTDDLAVAHVITTLVLTCILPAIGMGLAAASLAGQALGRNEPGDAKAWGWDVSKAAFMLISVMGLLIFVFPETLLSVFIHEQDVLERGIWPTRIVGLGMGVDAVGLVLMNALLGVGAARRVLMVAMPLQWLFFLPLAWFVGPYLDYGLVGIWGAMMFYRAIQTGIFAWIWHRGNWKGITL